MPFHTQRDEMAKIQLAFQQQLMVSKRPKFNKRKFDFQGSIQTNKKIKNSNMIDQEIANSANEEISLIDMLDYDCLEQIFIRLPLVDRLNARQVCTKWREASEFVWANVKLLEWNTEWPKCRDPKKGVPCYCFKSLHDLKLEFYFMPKLFGLCGKYVQELNVTKFTNSAVLSAIKGNFPNLVRLYFFMYEWKDEHFDNLFTGMTKLEFLGVKFHHGKNVPLSFFTALHDVEGTLKNLQIMNKEMHFAPAMKLRIYHLDDICLPTISRLQSLHTLALSSFRMNENTVKAISQLKNLKTLFLSHCPFKNVSMMDPLLNMTSLETLDPGYCYENSDSFLMKVPDRLKNFTRFQMFGTKLTDDGILALKKIANFHSLSLKNNRSLAPVTDISIEKFTNMQSIWFDNFPMITDDSIIRIFNNSPNLKGLHLTKTGVTFKTLHHIIDNIKTRTNGITLKLGIDLPEDKEKLPEYLPSNLKLEFIKE